MPRALWVTAEPPDRRLGGGSIRQAHLLEALGRRADTHLVLAGRLDDAATRAALAGVTEVAAVHPRAPSTTVTRRLRDLWRATGGRAPEEALDARLVRRALASPLARLAVDADVVCVEHLGLAPLAASRAGGSARWAITLHSLASQRALQRGATSPAPRQRWFWRREAAKARRLEQWAASTYDLTFVVSPDDARDLGRDAVVVPNGVDVARFTPSPLPPEPRLVFTGTLSYLPNVEGLEWFCAEVLPRVRAAVPEVSLEIAGRDPVERVRALAARPGSGVTLAADVPDVVPHLRAARVAVAPLHVGSGTRLKVLEAMAAGRPVVGTTIGLAGLGLVDGAHAVVADDPTAMAEAIVGLLGDDGRAAQLAADGRALVLRSFAWDAIASNFVDVLLSGR
jgi:glycosyltransferase involved in cell wall biosynthesis